MSTLVACRCTTWGNGYPTGGAGTNVGPTYPAGATSMATRMQTPNRAIAEIELLSTPFGDVQFDPDDPSTVVIERFDLPPGFDTRHCRLRIDLGRYYPELPLQDFYLSRGLRKNNKTPTHYFEDWTGKKYCRQGWA